MDKGIRRVILGTIAVRDPALVREACKKFPGRVAVGIDAKGGKVAVEGWAETSELTAIDLARRFEDAGVAAIIYTDIDRDGVLKGLNLPSTAELARSTKIPVIASGGLASIDDIKALMRPNTGCSKARSPAARSMMAASIPNKHSHYWRPHEHRRQSEDHRKFRTACRQTTPSCKRCSAAASARHSRLSRFDGGLFELHVGEAFGKPAENHQIWLEPDYLKQQVEA